ncbi:hypothetical protein VitviT2T_007393 [Vitis vinifera]|uniref:Uncharacterized protein n=1 Tax=Vitis vinifera TaxID=29760 RepID=A0ABY9C003_VITVI|nr:hypothetical protein VitviT2T_007393 [Vitis vinifera]
MKPKVPVGDTASKIDIDVLPAAPTPNGDSQAGPSCYIRERIFQHAMSKCISGEGKSTKLQWLMKELEVGPVRMKEQVAAVGCNADLFNLESLCYVNPAAQWLVFGPRIEVTLDQRVE